MGRKILDVLGIIAIIFGVIAFLITIAAIIYLLFK